VQHVGSWLLLGVMNALGVYEIAARCAGQAVELPTLRAAVDAVSIALAIGEGCVEGVRRLETPSMGALVRHADGISASWVRRVLHEFADVDPAMFQGAVASRLLRRTADGADRVVLYVDNHLRPYTGQHVIRKGWRMQDKRAVPGTTDHYVYRDGAVMLSGEGAAGAGAGRDALAPQYASAYSDSSQLRRSSLRFHEGTRLRSLAEDGAHASIALRFVARLISA
jgi:hypothetical protein